MRRWRRENLEEVLVAVSVNLDLAIKTAYGSMYRACHVDSIEAIKAQVDRAIGKVGDA